jgi:hypothetical protein
MNTWNRNSGGNPAGQTELAHSHWNRLQSTAAGACYHFHKHAVTVLVSQSLGLSALSITAEVNQTGYLNVRTRPGAGRQAA